MNSKVRAFGMPATGWDLNQIAAVAGIAVLLVLLVLRFPVALALIAVSVGGTASMLGWQPALSMDDIIKTAWNWHQKL